MEVKLILTTLLLACAIQYGALAQTTHIVGDSLGWVVPPGGEIAYQTWAATKTFTVGDVLVFNFTSGAHDVIQVTRSEFDSCNITTTTTSPIMTTPARITLTSPGEHYYICTFSQHCTLGQKLAINVTGSSTITPPPPGNLASTFRIVGAFPLTFLAVIVVAFLYN